MKKTLFLSAILGAALCSSAFGQLTINVGEGQEVTQTAVSTNDGSASTIDSQGVLTLTGRLLFETGSTATFTATGESIKSTLDGFWLQLQGDSNPASASLLAHSGATATYNATGDIAVYKNSTLTIGSGVTVNTRGIYYSSTNTADNGKVLLESDAHVNLTKKSVFNELAIGSESSVSSTNGILANTVSMAGNSSLTLTTNNGAAKISALTVSGAENTFSSAAASTIDTLTLEADSALKISNTTLKVSALALSGNLSLGNGATLNLDRISDFSKVTLNSGSTLNLTLGETGRISETALSSGNGTGESKYTLADASAPHINGGTLKLNGAAATIADGYLTGSNGTYYINDAATFSGGFNGATNLVINNGTVSTQNDSSNGLVAGDIVVNAATLAVTGSGHDAFGYFKAGATKSITLNGTDAQHKATLNLDYTSTNTITMTTNLVMNGYAEVTGNRGMNTFRDGDGTGNITASGTENEIKVGVQIRKDTTVTVENGGALTLSGNISGGKDETGTLTKAGEGTLTITGNISGGTINGTKAAKTIISGNTISGGTISNATIRNSTITGGSFNHANVSFDNTSFSTGNVTFTGGNVTIGSNRAYTLANGVNVNATEATYWLQSGATLTLQNTTAEGQTTGGTLTLKGLLFGPGRAANTASAGNLNITSGTKLVISGEHATTNPDGDTSNGFMIWNGKAHIITIDGTLQIDHNIYAPSKLGQTTPESAAAFNVGQTGALVLKKGITFFGESNSLGTITVKGAKGVGGTLAIGGETTGSKATVTMQDGSKVVAIDETTSTEQVFTLNDQATVTFSGKGLDGTADNTLNVNSAINKSTAAVDSIGKVNFGDMNTVRLTVDGYTTVGTLTTPLVNLEGQSTLKLNSTYDVTDLKVVADSSAKLFVQTVVEKTGVGHDASHHVGKVNIANGATLTFGGANAKVDSLTLAGGATMTVGDSDDHDYSLTTSTLTVGGQSSINANLVVSANGTMDFSAVTGTGATLTMGCSVEIGDNVTVVIDESIIEGIVNRGETVAIITDVEAITSLENKTWHFQNAAGQSLDQYALRLEVGADGTSIVVAPEPATATLSLLALAALAARRKRH